MTHVELRGGHTGIVMTPLEAYWFMQFVHHAKIETSMSHKAVVSMQAVHENLKQIFPPDTH